MTKKHDPKPECVGRVRAVVDAVRPSVDGGRFAVKRIVGDEMVVDADCFTDSHDVLRVMLRWRTVGGAKFSEVEMVALGNDVWRGAFTLPTIGRYVYTVIAWVDHFASWRHELVRRVDADDVRVAAQVGAILLDEAATRAPASDRKTLTAGAAKLRQGASDAESDPDLLKNLALDETLTTLALAYPERSLEVAYPVELPLIVDRQRARASSWYEMFPRSAAAEPGRHGSFADVETRLPYIAELGFDVLYFPPIHPVGRVRRKGKNNALLAEATDVGSPWAIGADEGGHTAILPELGTAADFRHLVAMASNLGIDIALDIAFQCAPDHPWVKEHPNWFRTRPDGSVQYAENPPKKYQDIYPFNFETDDWIGLWEALKGVFEYWIGEGVTIFRVDNPHTKPFSFWEWVIRELKCEHPQLIFLAEAFTRPKVMHRLAKLGYTQSYTYFTWRNTKRELIEYFTELSQGSGREYFRPNVWPNTPDILHEQLHGGRRPVYVARLVLAATLAASYGIYGPVYELLEGTPREAASEEYRDSEKYQLRHWTLDDAGSLRGLIARINRIRRENPALQHDWNLVFCGTDNDQLIAYAKQTGDNVIVTVVNLDPNHVQSGWVDLDPHAFGVDESAQYQMHDLLTDKRFLWQGRHNFVMLDPALVPAHVMRLRRRVRSERDFDYFL
ncbi:MAG: alpha-1,4-glucan--maltose-1-phosphate maltosyltransferase [Burkholderiaceae bacterium]|nr:MAG: alpha-1,4-glucan--maltose-1-phosphate maltosyltransferase [Burkholderiaceae bacterium]